MFRSKTVVVAGVTGLLGAVLTALPATADQPAAATPCGAGGVFTASPPTCAYTATGTDTFTVPDGVSAVTIDLYGAEGGSAAGFVTPNPPNEGAPGGLGGRSRATLAVGAGQNLGITVGAAGVPGSSRRGEYARPGGFGHGSGGGGSHGGGGSGGGASDVRAGAFGPADRVLVAGGGGGAGNGGPLLRGGAGGPVAEPGGQGGGPEGSGVAGGGASQTAHGTGSPNSALGGPGIAGSDIDPQTGLPNPGSGGPGGNGARGGNGGGGGGGGYFGGGGGSGGGNPGNLYGAGGGGGSSFAAPTATDVSLLPAVNQGNGKAIVSFRYGASVTVAADTAAPLFGHPVTLTATVGSANPSAGTPGGTVTFSDGATELATVPLDGSGRARFRTGTLQPGSHPITARYGGDPGHTPDATALPAAVTVGFSEPCLTTARQGALTVSAGQALCIASGGSQTGPVTVRPGGSLAVSDARISGPVSAEGALALTVCRSSLTGPVGVKGSTGYVLIGSDHDSTACPGNTINGPLTLEGNTGGLQASANTVTGPVRIDGNSADGPLSGEPVPAFRANRVTGPLRCEANSPALLQTDTVVQGPRSGQCRL
ncbi:Ig-like domain-containing protein [Streptomyces sp. NBC_00555]|uniref:Ig-like domain-containing protein n=1 Tax=Streptomyces sp. NBC_00555 TaxID=2903662 RepID=UPI0022564F77|nr:Ig-like domain-containing protein [Streptomyces sp. NBC_00555]MCX5010268.1 Ig-like domain-containing protein [Streptomyces sp. NBC_00555]